MDRCRAAPSACTGGRNVALRCGDRQRSRSNDGHDDRHDRSRGNRERRPRRAKEPTLPNGLFDEIEGRTGNHHGAGEPDREERNVVQTGIGVRYPEDQRKMPEIHPVRNAAEVAKWTHGQETRESEPGATTTLANTQTVEIAASRNPPRKAKASSTLTRIHSAAVTPTPMIPTATKARLPLTVLALHADGVLVRVAGTGSPLGQQRERDGECSADKQRLRSGIRSVVNAVLVCERVQHRHEGG